jgi:hypothetical protein
MATFETLGESRIAYSLEYRPGMVRDRWNKACDIDGTTQGKWVDIPALASFAAKNNENPLRCFLSSASLESINIIQIILIVYVCVAVPSPSYPAAYKTNDLGTNWRAKESTDGVPNLLHFPFPTFPFSSLFQMHRFKKPHAGAQDESSSSLTYGFSSSATGNSRVPH